MVRNSESKKKRSAATAVFIRYDNASRGLSTFRHLPWGREEFQYAKIYRRRFFQLDLIWKWLIVHSVVEPNSVDKCLRLIGADPESASVFQR